MGSGLSCVTTYPTNLTGERGEPRAACYSPSPLSLCASLLRTLSALPCQVPTRVS